MAERTELPERDPGQVPPAAAPPISGMLTLLTFIVAVAALYLARDVLIPITLAILLSFLLGPLVNLLRAIRLGRIPSVLLAVALGLVLILGIAGVIGTQIADLAGNASAYYGTVEHKLEVIQNVTIGPITRLVNGLSQPAHPPAAPAQPQAAQQPPGPKPVPVQIEQHPSAIALMQSVLTPVVSPLATAFVVFVVSVFILLQREDLRDRLIRLFGSGDLHRTTVAMDDAARRLSRYFLAQLSVNTCFGCVIGIGLAVIGVPSPVLWGLMAMLLRFVPYIGVPIAAIMPIAVSAAVEPGWSMAIWTAVLYLVCESITGQAIEPVLYGHSTGLSPAAVVIAAIFWTWVWGPIGLILSTPLTLCLVVLGRHVPRLEFLDVLLGDRPALTEMESFYQRLLAGDTDAALELAEEFLKTHSLTEYYDEVALPGLQLASADARKGRLPPERTRHLRAAVEALVRELDDHHPADPPSRDKEVDSPPPPLELAGAWEGEAPVLCVAGRGPLDEAASMILAQLLAKHGIGARVANAASVARDAIGGLPATGTAMICVTYLDLSGTPVQLRNLLRRLRNRFQQQPIVIGLYRSGDPVLAEPRLAAAAGAERAVARFREALDACIEAARRDAAAAAATAVREKV